MRWDLGGWDGKLCGCDAIWLCNVVVCQVMLCDAKWLCDGVAWKMMCCRLQRAHVTVLRLQTTKYLPVLQIATPQNKGLQSNTPHNKVLQSTTPHNKVYYKVLLRTNLFFFVLLRTTKDSSLRSTKVFYKVLTLTTNICKIFLFYSVLLSMSYKVLLRMTMYHKVLLRATP